MPRRALGLVLLCGALACNRERASSSSPRLATEPPAAAASTPAATSAAAPPSASALPASSAPPLAAQPKVPRTVGEVRDLARPREVVLATAQGEVILRGVDAAALDWRKGDQVVVEGPEVANGIIDCTRASNCSLGLASGGDVVLRGLDVHGSLRLLRAFGERALAVGPSRRAWLEVRAGSKEVLMRSLAAATGVGMRRYKNLALLAPADVLEAFAPKAVQAKRRTIDLTLVHLEVADARKLLSNLFETPMRGNLSGMFSVAARETEAADVLDAAFALCGVTAQKDGSILELTQTHTLCARESVQPARCGDDQLIARPMRAAIDRLSCIEPTTLEVLGLAFKRNDPLAIAVLGKGPVRGDEVDVRVGDFLDPAVVVPVRESTYAINWRIDKISRDGVELVLEDPSAAVDIGVRRSKLPLRTE